MEPAIRGQVRASAVDPAWPAAQHAVLASRRCGSGSDGPTCDGAYADRFDVPAAQGELGVTLLGVSSLLLNDGDAAVLTDDSTQRWLPSGRERSSPAASRQPTSPVVHGLAEERIRLVTPGEPASFGGFRLTWIVSDPSIARPTATPGRSPRRWSRPCEHVRTAVARRGRS
jgi:hypothetical protein